MSLKLRLTVRSVRNIRLRLRYVPEDRILPIKRPGIALAALLVLWTVVLGVPGLPGDAAPYPFESVVTAAVPVPELPRPWPQSVALTAARAVTSRFASGSTLGATLRGAGASGDTLTTVVSLADDAFNVRRIRPGQEYHLYFDDADELVGFRYQIERQTAWFIAREDGGWKSMKVTLPVESRRVFIAAQISSSLHGALAAHTPSRSATSDLLAKVGDVYGWDVDFQYDLRYGDRLDLLVEERYVEGRFIGYGEIVAAEFNVGDRRLPVVRYRDYDGITGYYTPDGESLRRAFLRSPVGNTRVSSRFSHARTHPVSGVVRAHRGVDYAAMPGTPIKATADGVVLEAGYGAEPGRYVKLRHGGSYSSIYMHMSRIEGGVTRGVEVKQGQVIGYVGKTGTATGYHLHYGLIQGNRYVDPLRLQFPSADPIPASERGRFASQRDEAMERLRSGQSTRTLAVAGGGAGGM